MCNWIYGGIRGAEWKTSAAVKWKGAVEAVGSEFITAVKLVWESKVSSFPSTSLAAKLLNARAQHSSHPCPAFNHYCTGHVGVPAPTRCQSYTCDKPLWGCGARSRAA